MRLKTILAFITMGLAATLIVFASCSKEKAEEPAESRQQALQVKQQPDTSLGAADGTPQVGAQVDQTEQLPRLVDLGRGTCIPCKKMAPILEELKREYQDRAVVEVIDLRDDPGAAREYGIRVIPTQIFYDAGGEEVWRHEGFLGKDAIRAKFTEMGVEAP